MIHDNQGAELPDFLSISDAGPPRTPRPLAVEVTGLKPSHTAAIPTANEFTPQNSGPPKIQGASDVSQPKSGAPKIEIPGGSVTPLPPPPDVPQDDPRVLPTPNGIPLSLVPKFTDEDTVAGFPGAISVTTEPDYVALSDPKERVFLRVLEKTGRLNAASEASGLDLGKIRRRMQKDAEFQTLVDSALAFRKEIIVDEAVRRAVQGTEEPVYYMGAICGYKRVYSDSLLAKLMEGYDPEKFRANHKVTVDGTLGVATLVLPALATSDDWAKMNRGRVIDAKPVEGGDEDFGTDS